MVFWWVPYLSKDRMSDVNNGPGGDSKSGLILAPDVYSSPTRIVALFWPRRLFESDSNNGPSLGHS